ncbi:MAG: hypothetical protein GIS02_00060 [Methanosarcinales archaeon]|uniref:Uncharacterized protein n=1 Tax=Candidatus Ethanoperedens thermophilum TaxID=2766897 RepID=A0A848D5I3_9EURY|nr:hypothetical protein [Candidatus Ethanoperedens thermophilum]
MQIELVGENRDEKYRFVYALLAMVMPGGAVHMTRKVIGYCAPGVRLSRGCRRVPDAVDRGCGSGGGEVCRVI